MRRSWLASRPASAPSSRPAPAKARTSRSPTSPSAGTRASSRWARSRAPSGWRSGTKCCASRNRWAARPASGAGMRCRSGARPDIEAAPLPSHKDHDMKKVRLAGISGSLRGSSHNTAILQTLQVRLAADVELSLLPLAELPLYNPDLEAPQLPAAVAAFKQALQAADALVLCPPEYNAGTSGVL